MPKDSECTVELMAIASAAVYKVKKDDKIDEQEYQQTLADIKSHGYEYENAIAPMTSGGSGTTRLGALCLKPKDDKSPIVISFRGTKSGYDVLSDINIGLTGTAGKNLREAAYKYYQKIQKQNPGREIVLTGHSLGGHLAHYVGTKAYNEEPQLQEKPSIQVRTFNTAPCDTAHKAVFQKKPHLLSNFVNYRLSKDVISDLPLQKYQGNTFVFPYKPETLFQVDSYKAHLLNTIKKTIPDDVLVQKVGADNQSSKNHNLLVELARGITSSYQCRVEGQFFSKFRAGSRNLEKMQDALPKVIESLNNKNYEDAIIKLKALEGQLEGKMSNHMIDTLMRSIEQVKLEKQTQLTNNPVSADSSIAKAQVKTDQEEKTDATHRPVERAPIQDNFRATQQRMKLELEAMRRQGDEKTKQEEKDIGDTPTFKR